MPLSSGTKYLDSCTGGRIIEVSTVQAEAWALTSYSAKDIAEGKSSDAGVGPHV